jgi:hypothetical protein
LKKIPLTRGCVALVDDRDFLSLAQHKWFAIVNSRTGITYAVRWDWSTTPPTMTFMHKEILGIGKGVRGDHRDGNSLNNQRSNLRIATTSQNNCNRLRLPKGKTSRYRGVSWDTHNGAWKAAATFRGKHRHFGHFGDEREAAKAFDRGVEQLYEGWAVLNFPSERGRKV